MEELSSDEQWLIADSAKSVAAQNRDSGGRKTIPIGGFRQQVLGQPPPPPPPPPPGLTPQQQQQYAESLAAVQNASFDVGYRSQGDVEKAITDAIGYQDAAMAELQKNYAILGSNAPPEQKRQAQIAIDRLSSSNLGDVEDKGSPFAEFRESGASALSTRALVGNATPEQAAAAILDQPTAVNPQLYQASPNIQNLIGQSRQDRANIDYYGTPQAQGATIPDVPALGTPDYRDDFERISAEQIADIPQLAMPSYNNNLPQMQAVQIGNVGRVAPVSYQAMPQMTAAQVANVPMRQIGQDELINSAPIDMVQSLWEDPEFFANIDPRGLEAMGQSIDYFSDLVENQGRDAVSDAHFAARTREAEQRRRSTLEAGLADLEARGLGTSGAGFQAQIQGANQSMKDMYTASLEAAAMQQQRADAAAQNLAIIGEADRRVQFGEAATREEALRQISIERANLEMTRQQENTATITDTRQLHQAFQYEKSIQNALMENDARINNLRVQANELSAQNRHREAVALDEFAAIEQRKVDQALMESRARESNLRVLAEEHNARNRFLESGALQDQELGAQRNFQQSLINQQTNEFNASAYNNDLISRNRFAEAGALQGQQLGAARNVAQAGLTQDNNQYNTGLYANESQRRNAFLENSENVFFDAATRGALQDPVVSSGITTGNLDRGINATTAYNNFLQGAGRLDLENRIFENQVNQQPSSTARDLFTVAGITQGFTAPVLGGVRAAGLGG